MITHPFNWREVQKHVLAGTVVGLGPHVKLARIDNKLVCECSRCHVTMSHPIGQAIDPATLQTADDFAHFTIRHQHREAVS